RADVQAAQAQLVADVLGVLVLVAVDRVAAPAHHQVRFPRLQQARVAEQAEHHVGDAGGSLQFAGVLRPELDGRVCQVAHEHEHGGGVPSDAHRAVLLAHVNIDVGVQLLRSARVVDVAAAGEHRQRGAGQQVMDASGGVGQARDLFPREDVQSAARVYSCVD